MEKFINNKVFLNIMMTNNTNNHWAYKIAEDLYKKHGDEPIVIASGISPSGPVHIGNLREVMTTDLVHRALNGIGANSEFIFSWDDFDRFRKVPYGIPADFKKYIGMPYTSIPDPFGEYNSYAERFKQNFEQSLSELGINPRFISQTEMYQSGKYDKQIKLALDNRQEIGNILAGFMTQGMTEEQLNEYYPVAVYSRFTGKDLTKVLSYDGDSKIRYLCKETGKEDEIDFTEDRVVKLPWKVDWPMRWKHEGVVFEPGGPEHSSPTSSYSVSSQISKKVFDYPNPDYQTYGFIRIKGQDAKMSSSTGNVITPDELLNVYSPEMVRWIYSRTSPNSQLDVALDKDVIRVYSEFDKQFEGMTQKDFALISVNSEEPDLNAVPFRKVFGLGEATSYNLGQVKTILSEDGEIFSEGSIEDRLTKSDYWSKKYYPEGRSKLLVEPNGDFYSTLFDEQKQNVSKFLDVVKTRDKYERQDLDQTVYAIVKKEGMSEKDMKNSQKAFFKTVYNLLFGKDMGPRLPTYVWAIEDSKKLENLLSF